MVFRSAARDTIYGIGDTVVTPRHLLSNRGELLLLTAESDCGNDRIYG